MDSALRIRCFICFESETGKRWQDHFVTTQNGHPFHYCCIRFMMEDGSTLCPVCDEDLQYQTLTPIPGDGRSPTARSLNHSTLDINNAPNATARAEQTHDYAPQNSGKECAVGGMINLSQSHSSTKIQDRINETPEKFIEPVHPSAPDANILIGYQTEGLQIPLPPIKNKIEMDRTRNENIAGMLNPSYSIDPHPRPDYIFKITILGDSSVGKSSLLRRYADEAYDPNIFTTVGCDLRVKTIEVANKIIRLNMWDTAGQERYRSLVGSYLRNADAILMCFDITEIGSLISIQQWNDFANHYAPPNVVKLLVGTKTDLWDRHTVEEHHAMEMARLLQSSFVFCSAKDAFNVEAVFRTLTSQILENRITACVPPGREVGTSGLTLKSKSRNKKTDKCC